jgi:hypothetical protein
MVLYCGLRFLPKHSFSIQVPFPKSKYLQIFAYFIISQTADKKNFSYYLAILKNLKWFILFLPFVFERWENVRGHNTADGFSIHHLWPIHPNCHLVCAIIRNGTRLFYSLKLFTYLIVFHYATFGGVHGIGAFHPVAVAFVAFALLVPAEDMRVEIPTKI